MKGIIFTEFLELVEQKFGFDMVDEIIEMADLPTGGEYTAVGSYDHQEIVGLVMALSEKSGLSPSQLQKVYGNHLFSRFPVLYPELFVKSADDALGFLEGVETYVHVEVKKLYPEAELPTFETHRPKPDELVMIYSSKRHFSDLAEGLIEGCIEHFGGGFQIERAEIEDGDKTRFHIKK